jgi:hypothetical protein
MVSVVSRVLKVSRVSVVSRGLKVSRGSRSSQL